MASRWAKNLSSRTLICCCFDNPHWRKMRRRGELHVSRLATGVARFATKGHCRHTCARKGVARLPWRATSAQWRQEIAYPLDFLEGKKIKDHQTGREARMRVLRNGHRNSARNKTLGIASDRGRRRGDESTVSVINALGSERRRKEALAAPSNAKKNFSSRVACVRGPKKCVIFCSLASASVRHVLRWN
jgi:hypothetical protein